MAEPYEYFNGKKTGRIYISKRILDVMPDGSIYNKRYVSKVIDSKEGLAEIKQKKEIVLRTTPNDRQEIVAKVFEKENRVSVLTIQKYTKETGAPHSIYFSFVGEEIKQLKEFIDSIPLLSFEDGDKSKIEESNLAKYKEIFRKNPDIKVIEEILKNEVTDKDVVGLGYRKHSLEIFKKLLYENYLPIYKDEVIKKTDTKNETAWQYFFENNPWIFGYGLNYIYCDNIPNKKLEQVVSGFDFNEKGKRVDALMSTMSKIQQFVLVEIKLPSNNLVSRNPRVGCWSVSDQVMDGIAQIQKTEMKLKEKVFSKAEITDKEGNFTGQVIYNYTPKSYLIIGNLSEFCNANGSISNEDKYSSFQLFRKSTLNPEIITYDELYERAKFIVNSK